MSADNEPNRVSLSELRRLIMQIEQINSTYHKLVTDIVDEEMEEVFDDVVIPLRSPESDQIQRASREKKEREAKERAKHNKRVTEEYGLIKPTRGGK